MGNCMSNLQKDVDTILSNIDMNDVEQIAKILVELYEIFDKLTKIQQQNVVKLSKKYLELTKQEKLLSLHKESLINNKIKK